jgi:ribosome biogenesis GTPase
VESSGIQPTLVLNKVDLEGAQQLAERWVDLYGGIGYQVLVTSAADTAGIAALRDEACTGLSAFIGPSGAGKSSLLNAVDPTLSLRTRALSRKTGTGRHTTVGSRIIELGCGGWVADTPGFGDVGLWSVEPEDVGHCFPEFGEYAEGCRFRGCTHIHEPGCAVLDAVSAGEIPPSRHGSYMTLREESEAATSY